MAAGVAQPQLHSISLPLSPANHQYLLSTTFKEMNSLALSPSNLSLPSLLKSCAKASDLSTGKQLHALSFKLRLSSDLYIQTSLLSMYSSCAQLHFALKVFDHMPHRNVVSWTASIDACLRSGVPGIALRLFDKMRESGVQPDGFSLVSLLSACSTLGALNLGRAAHCYIEKMGLESAASVTVIRTALIAMYWKCGNSEDAMKVFDTMPAWTRTVQSWNAMLHGLFMHGRGAEAVDLFAKMEMEDRAWPNEVTFVVLLSGCTHAGMVMEGRRYFELMRSKYGIEPNAKHYGCMVDLLGRAGLLDEAFEMVSVMPVPANHIMLGALLSTCRAHNNVGMAERMMERIIEENRLLEDKSHYVIMSNMYKQAGLTEKQAGVRMMVGKKPEGRSWIEAGGTMHVIGAGGDASLPPL